MSLADAWDRLFWSAIIGMFVGLVWLKFLDPVVPCAGPGAVVAVVVGGIYFWLGWRKAKRATQTGDTNEEGRS